ncbi:hypothetical protein VNO77_31622 [Canavalia gladiata]|uniref:Uncharacterized protein n=1 Tax=Canavalia gladiata TaxID=3824 RepID=A0AAN9Q3S2_CANGL
MGRRWLCIMEQHLRPVISHVQSTPFSLTSHFLPNVITSNRIGAIAPKRRIRVSHIKNQLYFTRVFSLIKQTNVITGRALSDRSRHALSNASGHHQNAQMEPPESIQGQRA